MDGFASDHARQWRIARPDRPRFAHHSALGAQVSLGARGRAFPAASGGQTRTATIILGGGFLSVLCLLVIGFVDPGQVYLLLAILAVVAFATATVDIACDGYAVQSLSPENYGWGNAAQVGGAYLGSAIGAGAFLILVDKAGWQVAIWTMAAVLVLLGLPFAVFSRGRDRVEDRPHTPSCWPHGGDRR